ncbi:acyl-CoA dehydrogenase family protein [Paenibacillus glycanilyticus]|uniref:Butyryl-CoA dehydrogenase n=1 Tax=Paenibacillus glycanilyticus TaxID=126569 RepID=A0ABQ6GBR3_9BACL|nr:acyl-CoA dehydrogenase family protein [Paenibacillus glycanilyticus]GLX67950.1 butyryl-CoA dehydrogenase [Paenibacillus glycanilyticus]
MRFQLDEEYELTRAAVRDYAEGELAEGAGARDELQRLDGGLLGSLASMGLTGIPIDERFGGAGSDLLAYVIVLEELARVCASTSAILHAHTSAAWVIDRYGGQRLRKERLMPLTSGARLGTLVLADPRSNLIPSVELAGAADDYVFLVLHVRGKVAIGIGESDSGVFTFSPALNKLGLRGMPAADLLVESDYPSLFNAVNYEPKSKGKQIVNEVKYLKALGSAAQAVGIAQGAMEAALAYAKERTQFGKPIGRAQGIAFKLADMAANVEASRWLVYEAAWSKIQGLPECDGKAAMAELYAIKHAVATAIEAVQIFGGYGYMREYGVERLLRDAKCLEASCDREHSYSAIYNGLGTE